MKVKALRLAAYLLMAHFLILLGLAFLGRGTPNYAHLVVAFAILIAACAALFSPRRRGWLAVVAYAFVVLGQHAMGLWVAWTSPAIAWAANVAALIILAVIDSLVVAALVLVFKPASFAAFAEPAPGAGATQDPAAKG